MDKDQTIYTYITDQEALFKTERVPITSSKDWNMHEHIERCTNVANAWFHKGQNDGNRPYADIVTPILNVAERSEGFDVKHIVPYVNDADNYYKSFLVKKYHPQWARRNNIDTFLDELVSSSIVYDLALVKDIKNVRPEVVPLQSIAFCDQTDALAGPLCLKHFYSPAELMEYQGKWYDDKIEEAIVMMKASKTVSQAGDAEVKTPGKTIEVYELHGMLPDAWLDDDGGYDTYSPQLHICTYYTDSEGKKNGITLFKGPEKKLPFKQLVIKKIFGRACGRSIIESLFEDQVWSNYSGIRIKELLDAAAVVLFQTDSDEFGNQKVSSLKSNTILKHETGKPVTKLDTTVPNISVFTNDQIMRENRARTIGSASDAQLGTNPTAGTPFALQNLVVQQGQGIHEFRQGKIATFVADELYRDWILGYLVKEMNMGKDFSEELSLDELQEIAEQVTKNEIEKRIKKQILTTGKVPTEEERQVMRDKFKEDFLSNGNRVFFKALQGELAKLPIDVYINIVGKQKNMAKNADAISNIIQMVLKNPGAIAQVPGVGKAVNELLEDSGLSAIDFAAITKEQPKQQTQPLPSPVAPEMAAPVK